MFRVRLRGSAARALFLAGLLAATASCGSSGANEGPTTADSQSFAVEPAPGVEADWAQLHTTIMLSFGQELGKAAPLGGGHPLLSGVRAPSQWQQLQQLKTLLLDNNVRVLDVRELLDDALVNARREGKLSQWLRDSFPLAADDAVARLEEIDAASLLNLKDDHFYRFDEDGALDPLFPGAAAMYWARDFASMTPKGVVIGNSRRYSRSVENLLIRLAFEFAQPLSRFEIAFDSAREEVFLDGGDLIVLDPQTIALGVGNRTSPEAAPKLAQSLGMDVLAVNMPPRGKARRLQNLLLHLDTTFNVVDYKTALAVPFFYEKEYSQSHPVEPLLSGAAKQLEELKKLYPKREFGRRSGEDKSIEALAQIGRVTRYRAGSSQAEELDLKLVDYLRSQDWRIVYVGGDRGETPLIKHFIERVLKELRWQGGNVVQLGPGRVIAYQHNQLTNEALRQAGIEVLTFDGELLAVGNGGPHCLLMPIIRANPSAAASP